MQLIPHFLLDLLEDLFFTPEGKELPLIAVHVGKLEPFLSFDNGHIKSFLDVQDDLPGDSRRDNDIIQWFFLWFLCCFLCHAPSPVSFTYLDAPAHNTWAPPYAPDGVFGFAQGVHAPPHEGRATGQAVINKNKVVVRVVKEVTLGDPVKDILGFPPRDGRPPGKPDRRIFQDKVLFHRNIDQPQGHLGADTVDDLVEGGKIIFFIDLRTDRDQFGQVTAILAAVTPDHGDPGFLGEAGIDRYTPEPVAFRGYDADIDVPVTTFDILVDNLTVTPAEQSGGHAVFAENIQGGPRPLVHETGPPVQGHPGLHRQARRSYLRSWQTGSGCLPARRW